MANGKILHLSDLHLGLRFNRKNWDSLLDLMAQERPDLVVITGDLVNTPWFWTLRQAAALVRQLEQKLRDFPSPLAKVAGGGAGQRVIVVPGNHDTRLSGLIDIRWLLPLVLLSLACAALGYDPARPATQQTGPLVFAGMALLFLVLRAVTRRDLHAVFGAAYVSEPTAYAWLGVGIVPIDSSHTWSLGAHGKVSEQLRQQLAKRLGVPGTQEGLWIALVHHHPLPLPYDSKHESVMIMKNAGLLLRELANYNVQLVLHGHKHHQHLSRLLIEDHDKNEKCISVLAAGTPTERATPYPQPHSFNLLTLDSHGTVDVTVFASDGQQSFVAQQCKSLLTSDMLAAGRMHHMGKATPLCADRLVSLASIDEYGNCRVVREFSVLKNHGDGELTVLANSIDLPGEAAVVTDAFGGSENRKGVSCTPRDAHHLHKGCDIKFQPALQGGGREAVDFSVGYFAMNLCALNKWQFANMYARDDFVEEMVYHLPTDISIRQFYMHLRFPPGTKLPADVRLQIKLNGEWKRCPACEVVPVHAVPIVCARIQAPLPGAAYRFIWSVEQEAHPPTVGQERLRRALLKFDRVALDQQRELFQDLLGLIDELLRRGGNGKTLTIDDVCMSLYAYQDDAKTLRLVGSGRARAVAAAYSYRYGVDVPGMAMKTGRVVLYQMNTPYGRGWVPGQEPWPGHRRDRIDVDNEGQDVVAVPLYDHHDLSIRSGKYRFEGVPYGVLRLSVDGVSAKLRLCESSADGVHATFCAAASILLSEFVSMAILKSKEVCDVDSK